MYQYFVPFLLTKLHTLFETHQSSPNLFFQDAIQNIILQLVVAAQMSLRRHYCFSNISFEDFEIFEECRLGILDNVSHFSLSHGFFMVRVGFRMLYHVVKFFSFFPNLLRFHNLE